MAVGIALAVFMDRHWRPMQVRSATQDWPLYLPPAPVHLSAKLSFARFDFYDTRSGAVTVSPHGGLINPSDDPTFNRWLAAPWHPIPWARWQAFWV
jgi:hypothetical protein